MVCRHIAVHRRRRRLPQWIGGGSDHDGFAQTVGNVLDSYPRVGFFGNVVGYAVAGDVVVTNFIGRAFFGGPEHAAVTAATRRLVMGGGVSGTDEVGRRQAEV